jgi:hypothetical protein
VLTTIHQPSGKVFSYYDGLLLLSRDVETRSGNIVYFGEAGKVAKQYFMDMGYEYDPDEVDNIAEYAINIISGGVSGPQGGNTLINHYNESDLGDLNHNISEGIARPLLEDAGGDGGVKDLKKSGGAYYANGFMSEFFTIFSYKGKNQFTDLYFLASRIGLYAVAALLLVSLYATPNAATPQGLIIVLAVLFITIFITGIITIIYIPGLILDKPVFIRESNDGCYRTISYTCANFLIEAIAVACSSIVYTCVLYWAIEGLNTDVGAFFFFMFTHFVYSLTACVITLTIASPLPSIEVSIGAVAVYALLNVAIMGFLSQVPVWWGWACFISYMRWGFGALMINQFENSAINLCGDVSDPMSLGSFMDLAANLDNLTAVDTPLNINEIVCGMVKVPTMSASEIFQETCPTMAGVVGDPVNTNLLRNQFGCTDQIIDLLSEPMSEDDIYNNLGTAILSFFPQGENYDAQLKFIDYDKWWCVGFLACIFVVMFGAYWYTSVLSIRLVKR